MPELYGKNAAGVWSRTGTLIEKTGGSSGLTAEQIAALDGMFKIASYTADPTAAYNAFKAAFGIGEGGEVEPEQPESGIIQTGSVLAITSGVTATQTGSVLAIA